MAVYTDGVDYAATLLSEEVAGRLTPIQKATTPVSPLLKRIFGSPSDLWGTEDPASPWAHILIRAFAPRSQYDQLIALAREEHGLPDRVVCLAATGRDFHGFKGRSWATASGNIHLSMHFAPGLPVERFEVAFTILAAVSVAQALEGIAGLGARPRIRWVNDILLDDGKVSGVLAYTQTQDTRVTSVVLGIGINVETTPPVAPTPFVPRAASLREFLPAGAPDAQREVLRALLRALDGNYRALLAEGYRPLLERYRERSMVVGREVTVCSDDSSETVRIIAGGRVVALGDGLELFFDGQPQPISRGRVMLGRGAALDPSSAAGAVRSPFVHAASGEPTRD